MSKFIGKPRDTDLKKCRLCFCNEKQLKYLYEASGMLTNVGKTITEVLQYKVSKADGFPQYICASCSYKLSEFKAFKVKCDNAKEAYELLMRERDKSSEKADASLFRVGLRGRKQTKFQEEDAVEELLDMKGGFKVYAESVVAGNLEEAEDAEGNHDALSVDCYADVSIKQEHDGEVDPIDVHSNYLDGIVDPQMMGGPMHVKEEFGIYPSENQQVFAETIIADNLEEMEDPRVRSEESDTDHYNEETKRMRRTRKFNAYSRNISESRGKRQQQNEDRVPERRSSWKLMRNKLESDDEEMHLPKECESSAEASMINGREKFLDSEDIASNLNEVKVEVCDSEYGGEEERTLYRFSEDTEVGLDCERKVNVTVSEEDLKIRNQMELCKSETESGIIEMKHFSCACGVRYGTEVFDNVLRKPFRCSSCGASLRLKDVKKYACKFCGKESNRRFNLLSHLKVHTGRGTFPCKFCREDFEKKEDLRNHLASHDDEVQWDCEVCGDKVTRWADVLAHQEMHARNARFTCDHCLKEFTKKWLLSRHVRNHVLPKECRICRKRFSYSAKLNQHMIVHTGVSDWRCDVCNKMFGSKENLKKHMNAHTRERSWKCAVCKKIFGRKDTLNVHMRIHSSGKQFSCELCDYKSVQLSNLRSHQRMHTGERYECPYCPITYKSYKSILNHKRLMHAEEPRELNPELN